MVRIARFQPNLHVSIGGTQFSMSPRKSKTKPIFADVVEKLASELEGPIEVNAFMERLQREFKSKGTSLRNRFSQHIRYEASNLLIRINRKQLMPTRLAMQGASYRIRLTSWEIQQGVVGSELLLGGYLPLQTRKTVSWFNEQGESLKVKNSRLNYTTQRGNEEADLSIQALSMKPWMDEEGFVPGDSLVVTVIDWDKLHFQVRREQAGEWSETDIQEVNEAFANALFQQLKSSRTGDVPIHLGLPVAYATFDKEHPCPPDCWPLVLYQDGRMEPAGSGSRIEPRSDDDFGFFLLLEHWMDAKIVQEPSEEEDIDYEAEDSLQTTYRLRVAYRNRTSIWRELEIQGCHTFADLDRILRQTFQHDAWDHLSGFWKREPWASGRQKSYRESRIGNIHPFGGGEAADILFAQVDLQEEDQLKYVYDFGDWTEHIITVKEVWSSDEILEEPRVVAQNKTRKRYCPECKRRGEKVEASLVCITCSENDGKVRYLCDACGQEHLDDRHEVEDRPV